MNLNQNECDINEFLQDILRNCIKMALLNFNELNYLSTPQTLGEAKLEVFKLRKRMNDLERDLVTKEILIEEYKIQKPLLLSCYTQTEVTSFGGPNSKNLYSK
jgi:hypothetical protein